MKSNQLPGLPYRGDFKNNSIHVESDEEYFSCDNTGASSPSQLKREGITVPDVRSY